MFEKKALLAPAIAMAALGLVIACGGDEPPKPEPTTEKSQVAKPPTKPAPKPIVERDRPPSLVEELAKQIDIPEDYPKDGPVYPGSHASTTSRKDGRLSVMFSSPDPAEDIVAYAADFLDKEGWENVTRVDMPNGTLLRGDKDGQRGIAVLVSDLEESEVETDTLIAVAIDP